MTEDVLEEDECARCAGRMAIDRLDYDPPMCHMCWPCATTALDEIVAAGAPLGELEVELSAWPPRPRGGQHVGSTCGVVAVHRETGIAVVCEAERSQHRNRLEAMRRLAELVARNKIIDAIVEKA